MIRWIDHLTTIAAANSARFPDSAAKDAVLANYTEVRSRYQQVIDEAKRSWGD
ncbi:MAG: hypothetical protein H8E66_17640 [Planctomycetes bacterium]|nr:hypothetical protein [Planctomycetota bacterium]